jgi:hypothetical protein
MYSPIVKPSSMNGAMMHAAVALVHRTQYNDGIISSVGESQQVNQTMGITNENRPKKMAYALNGATRLR